MLPLHCDHGAQLGQRQRSFGHQLISHIWIIISADREKKNTKKLITTYSTGIKIYQTTINEHADHLMDITIHYFATTHLHHTSN